MKILQINVVCGTGSTGRICTDLAEVLTAEGHKCKIAYGRELVPDKCQSYAVRIGSNLNTKLHGLLARLFDKAGFGSKRATKKFIKWIKTYDPDIIHLHNLHGYYINIKTLFQYLKTCEKPVIWTLHDCWSFTGHCTHFDYAGCNKWKTGCRSCPQKKEYPRSVLFDNSASNYRKKKALFTSLPNMTLITPSHWLSGLVMQSFIGKYPVEVIYNGIDLSVFRPLETDFRQKHSLVDKKIVLGVANVWDQRKGFNDFLQLSELLSDCYKIVLVGLTPEQMNLLPNNILGIQKTSNLIELAQIYSAADVYLNLSVEETMGLTTVEALACGVPCVVWDATAVPEMIQKECGEVIPKKDFARLKQSVESITSGEKNYMDSCLEQAKLFDKKNMYQNYLNIYKKVLE